MIDLLELQAREKAGMPLEWRARRYGGHPPIFFEVTGAVYPHLYRSGPRKGLINFKRPQPGTEKTVVITVAERDAWRLEWSRRTGLCVRCQGDGEIVWRCSSAGAERLEAACGHFVLFTRGEYRDQIMQNIAPLATEVPLVDPFVVDKEDAQ